MTNEEMTVLAKIACAAWWDGFGESEDPSGEWDGLDEGEREQWRYIADAVRAAHATSGATGEPKQ